jgi:quercetin dioxygenase-like cupin family protein
VIPILNLQFLKLTDAQRAIFERLKTAEQLERHGPLNSGMSVPQHTHDDRDAIYVVNGEAEFSDGQLSKRLGSGMSEDAVVVPAGHQHGWRSLVDATVIEHALSSVHVNEILAV